MRELRNLMEGRLLIRPHHSLLFLWGLSSALAKQPCLCNSYFKRLLVLSCSCRWFQPTFDCEAIESQIYSPTLLGRGFLRAKKNIAKHSRYLAERFSELGDAPYKDRRAIGLVDERSSPFKDGAHKFSQRLRAVAHSMAVKECSPTTSK